MKPLCRGLSLIEVLVVLAIIAILAAILSPVYARVKRSGQITVSISRLRQMHHALSLYQIDSGGGGTALDSAQAYYEEGLPPKSYFDTTLFGFAPDFWISPCGYDATISSTGATFNPGWIDYVAPFYDPVNLTPTTNKPYHDYLQTYRQNAVVFVDPYCNEPGTVMSAPLTTKRALAVLLSGQIINRRKTGNAFLLHYYSEPPSER
jgi:prepilin-type N-terminal cleavage/methylation domain-containing protein